jgi:hypothetical protein
VASLRALVRLARDRNAAAESTGLTILRALGAASPDERERASAVVALAPASGLEDPRFECGRQILRSAAAEIAEALQASPAGVEPPTEDPVVRFRARLLACEAELAAPGLSHLATEEVARLVGLVGQLAGEAELPDSTDPLANALAAALGRRGRRRAKRVLEECGMAPEAVASIDFAAWRVELRALAASEALRRSAETLRTALLALLADDPLGRPGPEADLGPLVERSPEARALLRRIVLGWSDALVKAG